MRMILFLVSLLFCTGLVRARSCSCRNTQYRYDPYTEKCLGSCPEGYKPLEKQGMSTPVCLACPSGHSLTEDGFCAGCPDGHQEEGGYCKQKCMDNYEGKWMYHDGKDQDVCVEKCESTDPYTCPEGYGGQRPRYVKPRAVAEKGRMEPDMKTLPHEAASCMCDGGVEHKVQGGDTLMKLAAKYGTSPYTLRRHNPQVKDPNPEVEIKDCEKLMVCPEDSRFRKDGGALKACLDQYPRPCATYQGQEQEDCFCAYQPDGDQKWPFDSQANTYITCKYWKSEGLKSCGEGNMALDNRFRTEGEGACTNKLYARMSEGCLDPSCFCRQFLLPPGFYPDPFDTAGRLVFQCTDKVETSPVTYECGDTMPHWDPHQEGCVAERKCSGSVRSYGKCEVTHLPTLAKQVLPKDPYPSYPAPSPYASQALPPDGYRRALRQAQGPGTVAAEEINTGQLCLNEQCCPRQDYVQIGKQIQCTVPSSSASYRLRARAPGLNRQCGCQMNAFCPVSGFGNCETDLPNEG